MLAISTILRDLPLKSPFRISGHVFESQPVVEARVTRGGHVGRGEASGIYYTGDTPAAAKQLLDGLQLDESISREELRRLLPAGAARNALDCALWELEAAEAGLPVWKLAGFSAARPLLTTMTLGADDPATMAAGAIGYAGARALKLKLSGDVDVDIERVRAVRAARPEVWIGVDANQGYASADALAPLVPVLVDCGVQLLEQPFKRGGEAALDGLKLPLPVAADESCLDLNELETLPGRFQVVNIKLDKCGGLTEGLLMARRAQELGLKLMVGNMVGTSLAMAPAFVLGQLCDVVDLDGPVFIARDPEPTVDYSGGDIWCPPDVWGPDAMLENRA
ncbi:dipeptide epimerase [Sandaracinobacter neustonicus]|uniref:Dipeptide epimerase n=2 Tax=Sandaracinobacter neustonicus TaxID=1715348 RepID=A0A501XTW9_9SPHN|nr:dipeptide epimerase [Sandaracinobacter neustonicus]